MKNKRKKNVGKYGGRHNHAKHNLSRLQYPRNKPCRENQKTSRVKGEQNKRNQKKHLAYTRSNVHLVKSVCVYVCVCMREREREILIRPGSRSLPFGKGLENFLGVSTLAFCVLFLSSFPLCPFFFIFFSQREHQQAAFSTTMLRAGRHCPDVMRWKMKDNDFAVSSSR